MEILQNFEPSGAFHAETTDICPHIFSRCAAIAGNMTSDQIKRQMLDAISDAADASHIFQFQEAHYEADDEVYADYIYTQDLAGAWIAVARDRQIIMGQAH